MTSAVIIILREVLEAMLIVCILLSTSSGLPAAKRWVGVSVLLGLICSGLYVYFFDTLSELYDGVGQEVLNALMLFAIYAFITLYIFYLLSRLRMPHSGLPHLCGIAALLGSISFAITREGAEIYLYLTGYIGSPGALSPILIGGSLGAGIGISIGALIYFSLVSLGFRRSIYVCSTLLVLVAAGMVSQGVNYLMQADLVATQLPLWDSSALIPENSVFGELLYALFSYEATPTPLQVLIYCATAASITFGVLVIFYMSRNYKPDSLNYAQ